MSGSTVVISWLVACDLVSAIHNFTLCTMEKKSEKVVKTII